MKIQERPALIYVEANIIASYGRIVINELYQYISFCLWKCVDLTACNKWRDCFSFLIFFVFGLVNGPSKASYIKQAVSQCFFARHSWFMYVTNFNPHVNILRVSCRYERMPVKSRHWQEGNCKAVTNFSDPPRIRDEILKRREKVSGIGSWPQYCIASVAAKTLTKCCCIRWMSD